jgi:hypothetical protein
VDLAMHDQRQADGSTRYCYLTPDGTPSPTLRLRPGDLLLLHFKNDLVDSIERAARPRSGNTDHMAAVPAKR